MQSSKKLKQMKNFDIDELFQNEQTNRLLKERLEKKKKIHDYIDIEIDYSKMREPEIFQALIVTRSHLQSLSSLIEDCAIIPQKEEDIGKFVYTFKIYNDISKSNWE
jgi:hypothetical protein